MSAAHTLVGTRHSAAGRKAGESEVTLSCGGPTATSSDEILLTVDNRGVWIDAHALREAVVALTSVPVPPEPAYKEANDARGEADAEPLHLRHSLDAYPLCWPQDRDGDFVGTRDETAATCQECLAVPTEPG